MRCISVPLVCVSRVGQVYDVILPSPSLQPSEPQAGPSEPCVWLFVSASLSLLNVTAVGCSPLPNVPAGTAAVLQCVQTACLMCDVAGTRWQRCAFVAVQQEAGAAEGSKRAAVAVRL